MTFYEPNAYERQNHRDIADPDWARVVVYEVHDDSGVMRALEQAQHADLVIKASGVGVFDALLERAVLDLRNLRNAVVFWDVDAPATLDRVHHDPADPFHDCIPRYDLILTYGGGDQVIDAYHKLGARKCVPIYNALDPKEHYRVAPDPRYEGLLGFMASRLPDREQRVEEFLLQVAAAMLGELQFGSWTNLRFAELERDAHWRQFNHFRSGSRLPGGDSFLSVQARAVNVLLDLRARHPEERVLIVSHGDVIKAVLMYFLGIPIDFCHRLTIAPASISQIELHADFVSIPRINDTSHLERPGSCIPRVEE